MAAQDTVRDSVVKIHAPATARLHASLGEGNPREMSGSGAIIDGKRMLTNAHVVLYASRILVQPNQSTERIPATVEAIAPGIDLAILKLSNEAIFDTRPPLPLDDSLPKIKNTVNAYGYPEGGDQLSVTEGIISRVEYVSYAETEVGMRIQVDAPVNRGNSGGPAVANGKIVGLVFSMIPSANNIGYLIPAEEIQMFLNDIADGKYEGKPKLLDNMQTVENKALRDKLGLDATTGGLMITSPYSEDEAYPLKAWDVITHIGDQAIDNQGDIPVGEELRMSFRYLIPKLVKDGQIDSDHLARRPVDQDAGPREVHQRTADPVPVGPLSAVFHLWTTGLHDGGAGTGDGAAMPRGRPWPCWPCARIRSSAAGSTARQSPDEELVLLGPQSIPSPLLEGYDNQVFGVVTHVNDVEIKKSRTPRRDGPQGGRQVHHVQVGRRLRDDGVRPPGTARFDREDPRRRIDAVPDVRGPAQDLESLNEKLVCVRWG